VVLSLRGRIDIPSSPTVPFYVTSWLRLPQKYVAQILEADSNSPLEWQGRQRLASDFFYLMQSDPQEA
jgi:hypothetical protein